MPNLLASFPIACLLPSHRKGRLHHHHLQQVVTHRGFFFCCLEPESRQVCLNGK